MHALENQEQFDAWGVLELFGHQKIAGRLTDTTVGGCHFIRVDVPAVGDVPAYTRMFTQGAIYGMTITTEDTARAVASHLFARPISAYDVKPNPALLPSDSNRHDDSVGDHDEDWL